MAVVGKKETHKKTQFCHQCELWCCFIRVGLGLYVIMKLALWDLEGPWQLLSSFDSEYLERVQTSWPTFIFPKGMALSCHMVGWNYLVHSGPYMIWCIGYQVLWRSPITVIFRP